VRCLFLWALVCLATKEMQIKTTLRFQITPVRKAIINNTNNECWWGCGGQETLILCWWESKSVQLLWKAVWRILKNLKIDLPHHPKSIYTKECKSGYNRATCTLMFIEALFIRAKLWKQHRFLITDGWIKKMCYIYTMEHY
jgi:hypothetical protein